MMISNNKRRVTKKIYFSTEIFIIRGVKKLWVNFCNSAKTSGNTINKPRVTNFNKNNLPENTLKKNDSIIADGNKKNPDGVLPEIKDTENLKFPSELMSFSKKYLHNYKGDDMIYANTGAQSGILKEDPDRGLHGKPTLITPLDNSSDESMALVFTRSKGNKMAELLSKQTLSKEEVGQYCISKEIDGKNFYKFAVIVSEDLKIPGTIINKEPRFKKELLQDFNEYYSDLMVDEKILVGKKIEAARKGFKMISDYENNE